MALCKRFGFCYLLLCLNCLNYMITFVLFNCGKAQQKAHKARNFI